MSVVSEVYEVTGKFPKDELYGLTSQLRRAAVSIAMNIAEGSGADSDAEFKRFLTLASKSVFEVMCGLEVAANLTYLSRELTDRLLDHLEELSRMLHGLVKKLKADS